MDVLSRKHGGSAGQAMVESAIVFPAALFALLGLLQMAMMQQARLFADYAAYRGARSASLEMASCDAVITSELAALAPMIGRTDNLNHWKTTFNQAVNQQKSSTVPVVVNFWSIDNPLARGDTFDAPVAAESDVSHVRLRLYFYYRMQIPFANWVIARWFLAQFYAQARLANVVDPLHPVTNSEVLPTQRAADAAWVKNWLLDSFNRGVYLVPLYASWTMPMFSRPDPKDLVRGAGKPCQ